MPPRGWRDSMLRAVYQEKLMVKPEEEAAFNDWYENQYISKLMQEVQHFTAVSRFLGELNGVKVYITEYECTSETMPLAIAEMLAPSRTENNAEFYRWRDRAITLHESVQ